MKTLLKSLDLAATETSTGSYDENGKEIFQRVYNFSLSGTTNDIDSGLPKTYKAEIYSGGIKDSGNAYVNPLNIYISSGDYCQTFLGSYGASNWHIRQYHAGSYSGYMARVVVRYTK